MAEAALRDDHGRMADLTHPKLVKLVGGRDAYLRKLEAMAKELKDAKARFTAYQLGEPAGPVASAGALYAVCPYTLTMAGPDGREKSRRTYLVCASDDGGRAWRFLDGAGVSENPGSLRRVLPDFPASLGLPEVTQFADAPPPTGEREFRRGPFAFRCPAAWKVNDEGRQDKGFELVTLDLSEGAVVTLAAYDEEKDPAVLLPVLAKRFEEMMPTATKAPLSRWGRYEGAGVVLRGRVLFIRNTVRVFAFNAGGRAFAVFEQVPDGESEELAPGLKCLEGSFEPAG
jgi:hypothetical protein